MTEHPFTFVLVSILLLGAVAGCAFMVRLIRLAFTTLNKTGALYLRSYQKQVITHQLQQGLIDAQLRQAFSERSNQEAHLLRRLAAEWDDPNHMDTKNALADEYIAGGPSIVALWLRGLADGIEAAGKQEEAEVRAEMKRAQEGYEGGEVS